MVWNSYTVRTVRHADVLTFCHNLEPNFTECPNGSFSRKGAKGVKSKAPILIGAFGLTPLYR
ncbi:MAG: hypothetical protein SCALA701_16870 [Candidatus Scalindua sp.]|nr:MAG: hypothetical protein SCALA701_16870 [Candidatus Scalindua sp.]